MALAPPVALAVIAVLLTARGISDGDFRYSDASRHAMDGVFVYDFVRDLPESLYHPLDYAIRYYARYPALGVVLYYPPFFAMVEAAFFAIFGISVFTARLTVVAFAVLAVVMAYELVSRIAGRRAAFLSAALFISLPTVVFWSRQVMLEMPTAAMILTAIYFFHAYSERGHRRSALWAALATVAAVMTKQVALFIVPAFGVYLILRRRWDAFRHWQFWAGTVLLGAIVIPYFVLAFRYLHLLTRNVGLDRTTLLNGIPLRVLDSWSQALGLPMLLAVVAALAAVLVWEWLRPRQPAVWLLAVMVIMFFFENVYLKAVVARFTFPILPVLACSVPLLLERTGLLKSRVLAAIALVSVLVLAGFSYAMPVRVVRGYREAAKAMIRDHGPSPFVFFGGFRDGDVTFYVRQFDPSRQLYVLRASKMLYTFASTTRNGYQDRITTAEGLAQFMHEYGIQAVAVEDRDLWNTEPGRLLRESLKDEARFEQVGRYPIEAPGTSLDGLNILVYQSKDQRSLPTAKSITIPIAGLQRSIEVPLGRSGTPRIFYTPWSRESGSGG